MKKPFLANYEIDNNSWAINGSSGLTESTEYTDADASLIPAIGGTITETLEDSDFDNSIF